MPYKIYAISYDDGKCAEVEVHYEIEVDERYGEDIDGRRGRRRAYITDPEASIAESGLDKETQDFLKAEALMEFSRDLERGMV